MTMQFAAVHSAAIGTKRTYRDVCYLSAFGGEADMPRGSEAFRSDANDPKRSSECEFGALHKTGSRDRR